MTEKRLRLGETLVEAGVITAADLERALELQRERQLRLGTILLHEGFVSEPQLVQALSLKLSIPWVSLWRVDIPDELLELVPVNVAEEFFLIPIYIRTTKGGERALYVAMNDPTDDDALRFVAASAGIPVKPMIAGPSDISAAIRFYYYGEEDVTPSVPPPVAPVALLGGRPSAEGGAVPPPPPPPAAAAGNRPSRPPPPRLSGPPPEPVEEEIEEIDDVDLEDEQEEPAEEPREEDPGSPEAADAPETAEPAGDAGGTDDEGKVFPDKAAAQREAERRLFGVGGDRATKGFSLTLLDGTRIAFGAPAGKRKAPSRLDPDAGLTRDDLLAGLEAAARGNPIEDFLPSDRWEAYTAALLGVLMRKHLVLFEEFSKELEIVTGKRKN